MNEWGVTDTGFYRPTYAEILEEVQLRAPENYGTDLNFSVRTFVGLFLRIVAWFVNILFQIAESVYHSGYVDTAQPIFCRGWRSMACYLERRKYRQGQPIPTGGLRIRVSEIRGQFEFRSIFLVVF